MYILYRNDYLLVIFQCDLLLPTTITVLFVVLSCCFSSCSVGSCAIELFCMAWKHY